MNKGFWRYWPGVLLMLAAMATAGVARPATDTAPWVGVKIYDPVSDAPGLVSLWQHLGINLALVSPEIAAQAEFMSAARRAKIMVFIISPVFYNPEALARDPSLFAITGRGEKAIRDWVQFVCPSRPEYRRQRIAEICSWLERFEPDGISLDFIRHFVFWEMVYPDARLDPLDTTCFCDVCLGLFQKHIGRAIPRSCTTTLEKAQWILSRYPQAWVQWRCEQITSMVEETVRALSRIKPTVRINVHLVPWTRGDFAGAIRTVAAQDVGAISRHADFLSPMCYWHMVKRPAAWTRRVVGDIARQSPKPILPSIQVAEDYLPGPITPEEFRSALYEALAPPSGGVILWNWPMLAASPEKQRLFPLFHPPRPEG